jgi:hypothetical protein
MRPADGFKGKFTLNISFQVQEGTVQLRPLLAGTTSHSVLTCAITQTPNLCDRESVNVGHLSSPLLPVVEHSERWHFEAPASSAAMQCAPPTTVATTSNSCFVAVVWTFWGNPPPYEIDWLSEVVDSSGCEAAHVLDLQMLCRGSLFSDSYVASKFGSQYNTASKVFVVSYFSKDFARGFGLMESCMLSWHLDGFDPVLVHFGDDSNSYEYLRYPRLHFVIRNHPTNTTSGDETFQNIIHLGIGYKIGFWPSTLRNISLRQVESTRCARSCSHAYRIVQAPSCRQHGCFGSKNFCLVCGSTDRQISKSRGMGADVSQLPLQRQSIGSVRRNFAIQRSCRLGHRRVSKRTSLTFYSIEMPITGTAACLWTAFGCFALVDSSTLKLSACMRRWRRARYLFYSRTAFGRFYLPVSFRLFLSFQAPKTYAS